MASSHCKDITTQAGPEGMSSQRNHSGLGLRSLFIRVWTTPTTNHVLKQRGRDVPLAMGNHLSCSFTSNSYVSPVDCGSWGSFICPSSVGDGAPWSTSLGGDWGESDIFGYLQAAASGLVIAWASRIAHGGYQSWMMCPRATLQGQ